MFGAVSFLSKKRGRDPLLRTKVGRRRHSKKKVALSGRAEQGTRKAAIGVYLRSGPVQGVEEAACGNG